LKETWFNLPLKRNQKNVEEVKEKDNEKEISKRTKYQQRNYHLQVVIQQVKKVQKFL
jgi:hypothetical protein